MGVPHSHMGCAVVLVPGTREEQRKRKRVSFSFSLAHKLDCLTILFSRALFLVLLPPRVSLLSSAVRKALGRGTLSRETSFQELDKMASPEALSELRAMQAQPDNKVSEEKERDEKIPTFFPSRARAPSGLFFSAPVNASRVEASG